MDRHVQWLVYSIVAIVAGAVGGHYAYARWQLDLAGTITRRGESCQSGNSRCDVLLLLDGGRSVVLGYRAGESQDIAALKVGDRFVKAKHEFSLILNGHETAWPLYESIPAFAGLILSAAGLLALSITLGRRRFAKR
jgi:hypothetical protein